MKIKYSRFDSLRYYVADISASAKTDADKIKEIHKTDYQNLKINPESLTIVDESTPIGLILDKYTLYFEDVDRYEYDVQGNTIDELVSALQESKLDGVVPMLGRGFSIELTTGSITKKLQKKMEEEVEERYTWD